MIEINLIPDVKYELLRARRMRAAVVSFSIFTMIAGGAVLILLSSYAFGVQGLINAQSDNAIESEYKKLSGVDDLSKTLTIQNQLTQLSQLQAKTPQNSRLFDLLNAIVPTDKNSVSISTLKLDNEEKTITMDAEASNGYEALEVFKKTIAETKFFYMDEASEKDEFKDVLVASNIVDGDRSFGQNNNGQRVLRFTLSFTYADELFDAGVRQYKIEGPTKKNATDSTIGVPESLFTERKETP